MKDTGGCVYARAREVTSVMLTLSGPMDCHLQGPLSMRFSRQESWSGFLCPPPGDLRNPGIKPVSLMSTCIGRQVLCHWGYLGSPYAYNRHPSYSNRVRKTKYFYFLIHRLKMIIKVFQAVNGFCRFSEPSI